MLQRTCRVIQLLSLVGFVGLGARLVGWLTHLVNILWGCLVTGIRVNLCYGKMVSLNLSILVFIID